MMKNHKLSKSIGDASWSEFKRQLKYKCNWNFKHFIEIDRWFPSSKMCSECGIVNTELTLEDRVWTCICGKEHNRDLNAAINILKEGLNTLGHRGINACGDDKVHDFPSENQVVVREAGKRNLKLI